MNATGADRGSGLASLSVMEGEGAYNEHSHRPAAGAIAAVSLLEQAARAIDPGPDDRPIVIAD